MISWIKSFFKRKSRVKTPVGGVYSCYDEVFWFVETFKDDMIRKQEKEKRKKKP